MKTKERSCGDCTACCTVMGVKEIQKEPAVACPSICSSGCAVYKTRPQSCKDFMCWWLAEGSKRVRRAVKKLTGAAPVILLREDERPDRLGVLFSLTDDSPFMRDTGIPMLIVKEVRAGAIEETPVAEVLARVAERRLLFLEHSSGRRQMIGPEQHVNVAQFYALRNGLQVKGRHEL